MGKLERLAAARERVRKWKALHPKSVEWQRKRWYARKKGEVKERVKEAAGRLRKAELREYAHYGETHLGSIEGVDVAYAEMEPERKGGLREAETKVPAHEETLEEKRTYARLEELVARRAALDKKMEGVQVDLIL